MRAFKTVLFLLTITVSGVVFARTPEPVVNLYDQPVVAASGKTLSVDDVKQLITKVAHEKNWVVTPAGDRKLNASLSWNGNKHTIVVSIAYETDRYSVTYKDSINMKYEVSDGKAVIHPYYNRYVSGLREAIRVELLRL